MSKVEIRHFHAFVGLGGGAKGFNKANPRVGNMVAHFRCIGGIDVDAAAIRDFQRLAGARGTVLDLFDRDQYRDFHDQEPPAGWREATPADVQAAAGNERPHVVFLSAPCKGFSGLLSEGKSKTDKYQALNRLTLRGVWLMLEAWKDDPVEVFLFENVPRIATRGRHLLDQIGDLFRAYGYAWAETTHDCGEIGNLAQSRKRFLGVARHIEKVPTFLYEPEKRGLRAVGDVLTRMPLPGDARGGPMHRVPALQWKTWVRLAFVEAGSDWRSLNKLAVDGGQLRDFLIVPAMHGGALGVRKWSEPIGVVAGASRPHNGAFSIADPRRPAEQPSFSKYAVTPWERSTGTVIGGDDSGAYAVADPRFEQSSKWKDGQAYGVRDWLAPMGTIGGQQNPGQGAYTVADPRHGGPAKHSNEFRIVPWDRASCAVTSAHGTGQGVADPRQPGAGFAKYAVTAYDDATGTVISGSTTGQGAFAVADPRSGMQRAQGDNYLTAGHYGVTDWNSASGAVSASACHDNGTWSVADPRPGTADAPGVPENVPAMPGAAQKLVCRIEALDGTWHRPFTTLELAALQSLVDPEERLELDGLSDQAWRERIGNAVPSDAVPSDAAQAIAGVIGTTLLLAWSGETFTLSSQPIWVRDVAVALSVRGAS